jgi:hypothetical protein
MERVKELTREAWESWLWPGLRKLHPEASELELVVLMQAAVQRDGMHKTLVGLAREFKEIGWPQHPEFK